MNTPIKAPSVLQQVRFDGYKVISIQDKAGTPSVSRRGYFGQKKPTSTDVGLAELNFFNYGLIVIVILAQPQLSS